MLLVGRQSTTDEDTTNVRPESGDVALWRESLFRCEEATGSALELPRTDDPDDAVPGSLTAVFFPAFEAQLRPILGRPRACLGRVDARPLRSGAVDEDRFAQTGRIRSGDRHHVHR